MKSVFVFVTLFVLLFAILPAQDFCPERVQVVLLVKMMPFITELAGVKPEKISIGILESDEVLDYFKQALQKSSDNITVDKVTVETLQNVQVLYLPRGGKIANMEKFMAQLIAGKIISVCGDPQIFGKWGFVISFALQDDKPKVMLGLEPAKLVGAKFSSNLMRLAALY